MRGAQRLEADPAVIIVGDGGVIVSANESAAGLFGRHDLPGTSLDEILDRSFRRGEWIDGNGGRFRAECFGLRPDGEPLELRIAIADSADDTMTRRRRDSLLQITTDVSRATHQDLDGAIVDALGRIGHLTRVDRTYLFMMLDDHHARNTHEWSRAGTNPQIDRLAKVSREAFMWFEERLSEDGHLVIQTLDAIPARAAGAREHLESQGIGSLLVAGVFDGGELVGFVGFDAVERQAHWSRRSVERIELIAELFIQSLLRARSQRELERHLTERMRTTRQLEESEARFRAVVENVSDVISIVDANGIIVYQSPASSGLFGYSPVEMIGQSAFEHVHPGDVERLQKVFTDSIDNDRREARATFRYRDASGHWLTMETVGANFMDREEVGGVVLVSRDITQRRQVELQLDRSTRLAGLGHLASSVAHEFNNVLMGAQPFVEVIRRTTEDQRIQTAASRIGEALDRGKEISRGLLQFARPVAVSLDTFDLRSWLRAFEDEVRRITPESVQVSFSTPEEPVTTVADPVGLQQALLNLILNASEVLDKQDDGKIEIVVRGATAKDDAFSLITGDPDDYVVLSVTDNGPAIDASVMEHVFEPMFGRQGPSRAGLGLTVVHQLITAQGGQVRVVSSDDGTSFHMFLRAGGTSSREGEPTSAKAGDGIRNLIMLVEDNEIVAAGIAAVLELEGQKVEIVTTGAAAIELLSHERPSVLILDIGLPDMSGLEVYDRIAPLYPDLPVVFSSGHGDQQELKPYLDNPNVEFLLKPYDAQTLMSIVERLRNRR